jgi:quercetin dioxygenase-like cupin family protein
MRRTAVVCGMALVVGVALGTVGAQPLRAQQEPVRRHDLLSAALEALAGREAHMVLVEFEPGAAVARHFHPGDELVYVLEGAISLEIDGQAPIVLNAGDAFHQPPKQVHLGRNVSRTDPARLLVIWVVEKGQQVTIPVTEGQRLDRPGY